MITVVPVAGQAPSLAPVSSAGQTVASEDRSAQNTTDVNLEAAIRERFARSKIAANDFAVEVRDGIAYLDGTTDVVQHKGTATRLAKLAGAQEVENRIEISDHGRQQTRRARRGQPRRVHVQRAGQPRSEER